MKKSTLLEIRAMASQRYTVEKIAEKLHISKAEAEYYVKDMGYRPIYDEPRTIETLRYQPEHGIQLPPPDFEDEDPAKEKTWALTAKEKKRIREMREDGYNFTEIAQRIGKHRDTIKKAVKEMEGEEDGRQI